MVLRNHPSLFAMQLTAAAVLASLSLVAASPLARRDTSVAFQGKTYVNKGLVGFGRISSELRDSFGETLGGLGSAIALESFDTDADGKASFSILMQPDRGHNTQVTTDYRARHHRFSGTFDAAATGPAENVALTYEDTQLYRIADPKFALNYTTGLDPTGSRAPLLQRNILLPIAAPNNHVCEFAHCLADTRLCRSQPRQRSTPRVLPLTAVASTTSRTSTAPTCTSSSSTPAS